MNPVMPAMLALLFTVSGCTSVAPWHTAAAPERPAPLAQQAGGSEAGATQANPPAPAATARKAPPRRAVWQQVDSVPPVSAPPSAYPALPVPQPTPMPAPPAPSSFPAQCGPLGCAAPDGTRLQGSATMRDPQGRMCVQGPVTVQCF